MCEEDWVDDPSVDLEQVMEHMSLLVPAELVGRGYRFHFDTEPILTTGDSSLVVNVKVGI